MGKGTRERVRATRRVRRRPTPPPGPEGASILSRIRKELGRQRGGGPVYSRSAAERRVLDWLQYELGADMDIDRDPRYLKGYRLLEQRKPRVLEAIHDPASVIDGVSYPLDTGEVVDLLQRSGLRADPSGSAVRRLADDFEVPQLGAGLRRTFFARHVLEIASALELEFTPQEIRTLGRHLSEQLSEKELVIAPMIPAVPAERAEALARRSAPVLARVR